MPLWKVYHPVGAYTAEDKKGLAERITSVYASVPIPKFYAVIIFEEIPAGSCFVGGERHDKFVRFRIDQIARTIPGPILREWSMRISMKSLLPGSKTEDTTGKFPSMKRRSICGRSRVSCPRPSNLSAKSGG